MTAKLQLVARPDVSRSEDRHGVLVCGATAGEFEMLARTLGQEGFAVEPKPGPADPEGRLRSDAFQIAIYSANQLSQARRLADRDAVYLIAMGATDQIGECMRFGADDFLTLPLDPDRVRARVNVARRVHTLRNAVLSKNATLTDANRQLEHVNRRMRDELQAAAAVQQSLLPAEQVLIPGLRVGWRLRSCQELAGDILNCFRLDEDHLAFYVLDVSGHGVSAALLSVQISRMMSPLMSQSSLLKESIKRPPWYRVVEPERVASKLNQAFQTTVSNNKYFTLVYGTLHVASGHLSLVSAGQPGPLLVSSDGACEEVSCRGFPIGFFPEAKFGGYETTLHPGTRLWLYSDGITEASGETGVMLGTETLRELVTRYTDRPPQEAADRIIETVEAWSHPHGLGDDCSLLAIERA